MRANKRRMGMLSSLSAAASHLPPSRCTTLKAKRTTHTVQVQASTLFEAGAAAVAAFRQQGWAAEALTPNAVLHIEVQLPPITHDVPLKAIERWLRTPSVSPKEEMWMRSLRPTGTDMLR
jgi:hypothetical protein